MSVHYSRCPKCGGGVSSYFPHVCAGTLDPESFDVDAFIGNVLAGDEFERIMDGVELDVPEGACPRCLRRTVWLNRVRFCGGCGWTDSRPGGTDDRWTRF